MVKATEIGNIPPTQTALVQHIKRAVYQTGHILGQSLIATPVLPLSSDWSDIGRYDKKLSHSFIHSLGLAKKFSL